MTNDLTHADCESEAARLLPWLVTARLATGDVERVMRHVEHCEICRRDLAHERNVRTVLKTEGSVDYAPQAALARTLLRINELARESFLEPAAPANPRAPRWQRFGAGPWLAAAVALQAIGLGVLGMSMDPSTERTSGQYETRSSLAPVAGEARIRAVFKPSMTLGELRVLLITQRLGIVGGPSDAGVFTLATNDAVADTRQLDTLLSGLRANAHVLFAEPATNDGTQLR